MSHDAIKQPAIAVNNLFPDFRKSGHAAQMEKRRNAYRTFVKKPHRRWQFKVHKHGYYRAYKHVWFELALFRG